MSTGLTYLTITDTSVAQNPDGGGTLVFSSYQEAYGFADWYARFIIHIYGSPRDVYITIYTTGPNNSGYYRADTNPPYFVAYD